MPPVSQGRPSQSRINGNVARAPNTHAHGSPLDLEHGFRVDSYAHAQALSVGMPGHPLPAQVRQVRRPIIQVPEPQRSTAVFNMKKLENKIDGWPFFLVRRYVFTSLFL